MPLPTLDSPEHMLESMETLLAYVEPEKREPYTVVIEQLEKELADKEEGGDGLSEEYLQKKLEELQQLTHDALEAMGRYVQEEGAEEEWTLVLSHVRPNTKFLLLRLGNKLQTHNLSQILESPLANHAFLDSEQTELALLRREIHALLWQKHGQKLSCPST